MPEFLPHYDSNVLLGQGSGPFPGEYCHYSFINWIDIFAYVFYIQDLLILMYAVTKDLI